MLRQMVLPREEPLQGAPLPVYIEGYGFVPPTQAHEPQILDSHPLDLRQSSILPQYYPLDQSTDSSALTSFSGMKSPTGDRAYPIPMPRTPDAYPYRRPVPSGLESTPEGLLYQQTQAGTDLSDMLSDLRFNVQSGTSIEQPFGQSIGQPIGQPIAQPIGQPIGQSFEQSIGQSIGQPIGQPIGQSVPASSGTVVSSHVEADAPPTFPQRWSYPGTSVLSEAASSMARLKIACGSSDGMMSSSVPGSANAAAHILAFTPGSRDLRNFGSPSQSAHLPATAATYHSTAATVPSLKTSTFDGLSCNRVAGNLLGEFTKSFSMPSGSRLYSPLVSPKTTKWSPKSAATLDRVAVPDSSWTQLTDPEGRVFWHQASTGCSQRTPPGSTPTTTGIRSSSDLFHVTQPHSLS